MGSKMERSRNISISLIFLSLILGSNINNLINISLNDYIFLGIIVILPHCVGIFAAKNKIFQNISSLVSALIGIELLLLKVAGPKLEKLIPTISNLKNISKQGQIGIRQFAENSTPLQSTTGTIVVAAFILWSISELIETIAIRLNLYGLAFAIYILFFALAQNNSNNTFNIPIIALFCFACWIYLRTTYRYKVSNSAHKIQIVNKTKYKIFATNIFATILITTICIAIVIPISSLPSIAPKNMLNKLSRNSTITELSPLVSMRAQLKDNNNKLMFTAKTDSAQYFRLGVLNKFDGDTWYYEAPKKNYKEPVLKGLDSRLVNATFELKNLSPKILPSIYNTDSTSERNLVVLDDSTISSQKSDITNYSIDASVPESSFTDEQIRIGSTPTPKGLDDYLLIPENFDPSIEELSRSIATNKTSIYEQVTALKDYFTKGDFVYSTKVNYNSSQRAMRQFLDAKVGFCEQFAATYAAMARSIRIPSRVIVGFIPGKPDTNGVFNVMSKQAHSWVEVYLTGMGWITIDPTPQGTQPGQAPSNIGEQLATTSSTTSTTRIKNTTTTLIGTQTTNTITQSRVSPLSTSTSSNNIFSFSNILFLTLVSLLTIMGFLYNRYVRKRNIDSFPTTQINNTYKKIFEHYILESHKIDITLAELKAKVPSTCLYTQKFLEQYSEYSYAPDCDIDIYDLTESANDALLELTDMANEKV